MASAVEGGTVPVLRTSFATRDADEARDFLDAAYGSSLRLSGLSGGASLRYERIDAGLFTVDRITLPGTLSFACEPLDAMIVNDVRAGRLEVDSEGSEERAGAGSLVLNPAGVPYTAQSNGCTINSASLAAGVVRDTAGVPIGGRTAPLRYAAAPVAPATPAAARLWRAAVDLAADQFGRDQALPALLVSNTARLLAAAALAAFPARVAPDPAPADETDATPATVRRATAFIASHADRDITLAEIADAACVTPRALQYAFRRHLGTTPLAHLRTVRLDAAHRELLAADPATATVTGIAMRWGFGHVGRFAAHYREAYGTTPSTTLGLRT
ncbi:helix-turn-helix transcriptional regulator [Kitasatospora sp. NPDC093679]|uniref:helix-turn-helix transcriptional regulator n=1 Tax=Kitasatospora sp. NPDC093679 TaxID=3154983 RepID=UPI003432BB59